MLLNCGLRGKGKDRQILTDWQEDDELPFADDYIEDISFRGGPGRSHEQVPFVDFQEVMQDKARRE